MKHRDGILDLIRGLSALLVMLGHLRGFLFLDLGELQSAGLLTKCFYFVTGLGHQAVMVFFVLSGFFVGGSILTKLKRESFVWYSYAAARFTRLWMVMLPALLLTLGVDLLGEIWNPSAYAGGLRGSFMSGPTKGQPAVHDLATFLGNLGFVQTVSVPIYGSNGPLWSLANEFWYYVTFPLVAVSLFRIRRGKQRWLAVVEMLLFVGIVLWLPGHLVLGGLIWLMGVGAWWLVSLAESGKHFDETTIRPLNRQGRLAVLGNVIGWFRSWQWRLAGGVVFLVSLAASKFGNWLGNDYVVGAAFAIWILSLTGPWRKTNWCIRWITGLSEISYTLYIVHFPLMFFVAAAVIKGRQFPANAAGFLWFGGLTVAILIVSAAMWWLFERNTMWMKERLWGK